MHRRGLLPAAHAFSTPGEPGGPLMVKGSARTPQSDGRAKSGWQDR